MYNYELRREVEKLRDLIRDKYKQEIEKIDSRKDSKLEHKERMRKLKKEKEKQFDKSRLESIE